MEILVNNQLDRNEKLFKAFAAIPLENYLQFYKKFASKQILDNAKCLIVEIKENQSCRDNDIIISFRTEEQHKNILGLMYLDDFYYFDLYKFIPTAKYDHLSSNINAIWQKFLTENLGEKLYKKLVAEKLKQELKMDIERANCDHDNYVKKLAKTKQYQAELKKREAQFEEDYADVLDENGEVLPIDETDIKKS